MNTVFLLLGTNLGDRISFLSKAIYDIEIEVGVITKKSSIYETEPWGVTNQQNYLNQILVVNTTLTAIEVLSAILFIEKKLGRKRTLKFASRTIDIDILFYNDTIIQEENLKVPHPLLQKRRFVLEPLNEIAADFIHPVFNKNIRQLLKDCDDDGAIHKIELT